MLDRDKQLGVVSELTEIVAAAAGDPSLAQRTWVLLTESPDGGWGVAGHANTGADLAAAARAELAANAQQQGAGAVMTPATGGRMSDDVIIGYDGKPRCAWTGAGDTPSVRYHDEVWGTRTYDESALFEALTLGVFEAGLSWSIVFGKRDAFRRAFHGFDIARVAAMTERDVDRLVQDSSIIRNRAKIQATVRTPAR